MQKIQHVNPFCRFSHDDEMLPLTIIGQPLRRMPALHEDVARSGLGRLATGQTVEPIDQLILIDDRLAVSEPSCGPKGDLRDALLSMKGKSPNPHSFNFA